MTRTTTSGVAPRVSRRLKEPRVPTAPLTEDAEPSEGTGGSAWGFPAVQLTLW